MKEKNSKHAGEQTAATPRFERAAEECYALLYVRNKTPSVVRLEENNQQCQR